MMRRVLVAASLEAGLRAEDDFQVVGTISELSEVGETPADMVVVDLEALPDPPDLFSRLKERRPELKVIAVGPDDPEVISSVFELGVDGYHVDVADTEELAAGLRQILRATDLRPLATSGL